MTAIIISYSYEKGSRAVIGVKQQFQVINQAKQITDIT